MHCDVPGRPDLLFTVDLGSMMRVTAQDAGWGGRRDWLLDSRGIHCACAVHGSWNGQLTTM
jgi:hypothetical protein